MDSMSSLKKMDSVLRRVIDEQQAARNNPESGNKEYQKKYGKVRGEKTPMLPRGDKRRV